MTEPDLASPQRGDLDRLIRRIAADSGFDVSHYRRSYLERRLASRMRVLGLSTYRVYAERLHGDPDEFAHLVGALSISVTGFFRDSEMWEALRATVIPAILAAKTRRHGHTLRIWSAGCATGEEAYSLAMAFLDVLGDDAERFTLSVHGTDVDQAALETAKAAVYAPDRLEQMTPDYLDRYFEPPAPDGSGRRVKASVRRLVRFQPYSLFDSSPMRLVDLVMCRNVFIYLNRLEQAHVLDEFWGSIMDGGYLVLGRSEKLSTGDVARFEPVDSKERIFRKPPRR